MNEYCRLRTAPENQYAQKRLSKLTLTKSTQSGMIEETEVSNPQAMREILTQFGVDKKHTLEISRERYLY